MVEFLNAQMPDIEVLAVEVKRFRGAKTQTLVPRVLGRTVSSPATGSPSKLTRELFLEDFSVEAERNAAVRLLDAAGDAGARFEWGPSGVSVRAVCELWPQPVTVAWLYPPSKSGNGWMKTRAFTFGAAILDADPDERLRAVLKRWVGEFEGDSFTDASSKGVQAWSIDYADAVGQADLLASRLTGVISEIRSLRT